LRAGIAKACNDDHGRFRFGSMDNRPSPPKKHAGVNFFVCCFKLKAE
jgi:hypothetical protein